MREEGNDEVSSMENILLSIVHIFVQEKEAVSHFERIARLYHFER